MDKVVYIAANAARRSFYDQSVASNNLANINTTGFKKDITQAKSYTLLGPVYPSRAYALSLPNGTDYAPGALRTTGRDLDVAISNDGWFAVQNDAGTEAYTRSGSLQLSPTGQLQTSDGRPVMGNGGPIVIPPAEKISISANGVISVQPVGQPENALAIINQMKLVNPGNNAMLKDDDGLFYVQGGQNAAPADPNVRLVSGALEDSNVNGVSEMVDMIAISRQYEVFMKMMATADEKAGVTARLLQQG